MNILSIESGTYRHNKSGLLYNVIGLASDTETDEVTVVYEPMYTHKYDYRFFMRSYSMFTEIVVINGKKQPRFEKI
ncbi:DUF1653 domain-containing protein [Candidatus Saccharibacteria bacterium]|nr:DUF1653 domain-containing protein [Candidatus Saccharibacteria bacterium]